MRDRCRSKFRQLLTKNGKARMTKAKRVWSVDARAVFDRPIANWQLAIENQLTHLPSSETRMGSSSIMNWVLPMAPIMRVPVAAYHFFDISSPV